MGERIKWQATSDMRVRRAHAELDLSVPTTGEADIAYMAELNHEWQRRSFSEAYGVRSPAGRLFLREFMEDAG